MRIRSILVCSAAAAVLSTAASLAQAGESAQKNAPASLSDVDFSIGDALAPSQFAADGSVYGVRANNSLDMSFTSLVPVKAALSTAGQGTLEILKSSPKAGTTITPGDCATAGFPGGWCDTAHDIAASAFGWDFHVGGKGVIIGMIDTGVDLNNQEFAGRLLPGDCIVSSVNACTLADDKLGGDDALFSGPDATHGTHTAGIAAGANVGIANQASILPVKVCGSAVDSCVGIDDGIVWASQHGASVISVSIGGPILTSSDIASFRTAVSNGALLVVAAGNSGSADPTSGFLAGGALEDGVRGSMIVVGATGAGGTNGQGKIASFSQIPGNRCDVEGGQRYCMKDYFVVAPGLDIWSSVGNGTATQSLYGYLSGTSMATPYVSGVAAVIKGQWPTLTSSQIANIIFDTTDDLGAPGVDPIYGRGAVDITKALAPVGTTMVAKSGKVATASAVANVSAPTVIAGAGNAQKTLVSGALSVAVQNSAVLKKAVMVDSFGRTFQANLSKASYNPGLDFSTYFMSQAFTSFTPFMFSGNSPLGQFAASGYQVDSFTPRLLSGELLTEDRHRFSVQDFEMTTALSSTVALNVGYNLDLAGRVNGYDLQASSAYDGLFVSGTALNSPYSNFTNGGSYVGATVALADNLHFHVGQSMLSPDRADYEVPVFSYLTQVEGPQQGYQQRSAQATMAGVDYDFASWGGLGITASNTNEQHGLLGGLNSGALAIANDATTTAVGASARVGFGDGWVTTMSYSEGVTQLDLKADSLVTNADTLHSRAYGIAVAKHGLFADDDSLGLAVSRPIQIFAGHLGVTAATGVDADGNLISSSENVSLASKTPETDLELGYVTTFFNGALALQANAAYQMNLDGQTGTNSLAVLSRAKINF